ncbi:uncharacterized protein LOC104895945 [Beta vulgaris subsp. vulgaris]|uniref:uncharacterized protein LOC104895945 n=1 Tax=Beta vulgaris subsp. vulgaris TaxID=3555 RepID=UPI002036F5EB|nr:uncharacterized protein LOC104895945 [Beta vulgaris subsp. vulgaris]
MGNPNVPNTKISEKEMEKAKEKTMKMMGLPLSTIFFHGNDRAILKNITPMGSTLIPRDIYTNIIVYPMTTHDGHMIRKFDQKNNASSSRPRTVSLDGAAKELRNAIRSNVDEATLRQILDREPRLYTSYNRENYTPLCYAAYKGFTKTVSYILKKYPTILDDNPKAYPIHKACAGRHLNILEMFHEKRGDESFFNPDCKGRTPLHVACDAPADREIFQYLMTLPGANYAMSVEDENRVTPRRVA